MISKLIFDLDGTLWETKDSFLYAYEKLSEEFPLKRKASENEILSFLGVKFKDLVDGLFKDDSDKALISSKGLGYSIEYMINNPKTYSSDIEYLFSELSKKYDIYIVSNCPGKYLEAFYSISSVKKYVKADYTIEDGRKEDNIKKITDSYRDKAVFVGDSYTDYEAIENHRKVFFVFAKYGYIRAHNYDYSIDSLDEILEVIPKIAEKDRMLKDDEYEVISSNDSNLTLICKKDVFYFGFVHFTNEEDDVRVIKEMKNKIGKSKVIGPINGSTWYSYRLSLDSYDFRLYPDALNDRRITELFLNQGFFVEHRYSSTLGTLNPKITELAKKAKLPPDYTVKVIKGEKCYDYLDDLYKISTDAFENADYYEPISSEDFKELYIQNIRACSPDLVIIHKKDEPIALSFSYEDPEKRFYVSKTVGIRKAYQKTSVLLTLIDYSTRIMLDSGYDKVLYHFQNDRTKVLYEMSNGCLIRRKYYGLLGYVNDK